MPTIEYKLTGGLHSLETSVKLTLIEQIKHYRNEFINTIVKEESGVLKIADSELGKRWTKSSQIPVLAVVAIKSNGSFEFHKGFNIDYRLQIGNLCAERTAMASALAKNINLKPTEIIGITVLGMPKYNDTDAWFNMYRAINTGTTIEWPKGKNPRYPCGVCLEFLCNVCSSSHSLSVLLYNSTDVSVENSLVKLIKNCNMHRQQLFDE